MHSSDEEYGDIQHAKSDVNSALPVNSAASDHSNAKSLSDVDEPERSTHISDPAETMSQKDEDLTTATEKDVPETGPQAVEPEGPTGARLALIIAALCLSVFCMALDNTIISTAIPSITDEFHAISDVGWYGSAYLLCTCSFQLFFGKLYTFLSMKWVYLTAIVIFEVGSAVCGAAPSSTALIIGRAIAGVGGAGIFSGTVLILSTTVPLKRRPAFMGGIGGMYGIASVAGPLLGGAFTTKVTWRWCFYINLPIGAVTLLFITIFYHPTARAQTLHAGWRARVQQFDILGLIIFLPMIVCLLLALQWGGSTYAWSNGRIIALLVVFAVLLVVWLGNQYWKKDTATVPFRIARQRSIAAAAWFAFCVGASFFVMLYYLPLWFQAVKGASAVHSGIMTIPLVLSLVVMSILSGILVTRLGYYTPFVITSSVLVATGAGMLSTLQPSIDSSRWIGYQVIFGLGYGFGMQHTLIAAQTVLPRPDIPIGTALITFCQTLGGAVFVSVAQNVFASRLISSLHEAVPNLDAQSILTTGATAIQASVPPADLHTVQIAYSGAITHAFYVAVALGSLSIIGSASLEWRSVKAKKEESTSSA